MARKRGMQYIPYDYEAAYNKAMQCIKALSSRYMMRVRCSQTTGNIS